MAANRSAHPGIEVRHQSTCVTRAEPHRRCSCRPLYRAYVHDSRSGRRLRKSFPTLAAAKAWRADTESAVRQGRLSAALGPTVAEAGEAWLVGARAGAIRNRSGDPYKPSAIRGYQSSMELRVIPAFGSVRLGELRRQDLQAFVDEMLAEGRDPSVIRNTLMPLRVICRRALVRGEIAVNPTVGLELPAVRGRRDRIASPAEAVQLLAALDGERAMWATAMFAGLRLGEIRGLRWEDVDLEAGLIHVRRAWDPAAGPIEPKSRAGRRDVPLAGALRVHLVEQRLRCQWRDGLVFGRGPERPFEPKTPNERARKAWLAAGLRPIGLHECRHTFASFMIAAGVNAKALSVYMGHSSVMITFDRYGHLMPGNEAEAARLLDTFLESRAS